MKITVDGREYEVRAQDQDRDLLTALLHLGVDVPYFCWHPALGSVGACRQCAVKTFKDERDTRGRIEMACMVPVRDGMRVSVEDPEAVVFRCRVIEWLMVNHPHDCPICDEGGECHLQDMTVMTGHVYRRYRGRKRTYRNQYLGPFVTHEMNRCIQCYRCVRFYRDYAGGRDFDVFASKHHVYFGRFEDGVLESEFSGNLVEICPTGVFTDKTLARHYTRKWDLETAPSICPHCGLGCNTIPGARYEMLRRVQARYHPEVNGFFLCDRGRYGYEFVNDPDRLRQPRAGRGELRETDWLRAMVQASEGLQQCRRVLGLGSPRASLEANYALQAFVGEDAFSPGLSAAEHAGMEEALAILREGPARSASLHDVEWADAILVLGTDPTNEAPMLDLALRRASFHAALDIARGRGIADWNDYPVRDAIQEAKGKLYLATCAWVKLEEIATEVHRVTPPELVALAWEVAEAVAWGRYDGNAASGRIAKGLAEARQPLVIASAAGDRELLRAAAEIARVLSQGRAHPCLLSFVAPECNTMGVTMLGGRALDDILTEIESGEADGLIVLENDPFRRGSPRRLAAALRKLHFLIALDSLPTQTTALADVVLPAATVAEGTGTYVNSEGRAQRFFQVFVPTGEPRPSWRVLRDLIEMHRPGTALWQNVEEVAEAMGEARPELAGVREAAPPNWWRDRVGARIARQPHRFSGRTAKDADRAVFEPTPEEDPDSPFAFSMEGSQQEPPAALIPRYWEAGWNSVQALHKFAVEADPERPAPGARLIEQGPGTQSYQPSAPEPALGEGELWIMPRAAIFGSEELSRRAEGIAELTPPACVKLHPGEAQARGISDGDLVSAEAKGAQYLLAADVTEAVARGVAVVPAGYPETAGIDGATRGRVRKAT